MRRIIVTACCAVMLLAAMPSAASAATAAAPLTKCGTIKESTGGIEVTFLVATRGRVCRVAVPTARIIARRIVPWAGDAPGPHAPFNVGSFRCTVAHPAYVTLSATCRTTAGAVIGVRSKHEADTPQ